MHNSCRLDTLTESQFQLSKAMKKYKQSVNYPNKNNQTSIMSIDLHLLRNIQEDKPLE